MSTMATQPATAKEKEVLRTLAEQVAEIAELPVQDERRSIWYKHNALERTRPIVLCYPELAWEDLVPDSDLLCEDETLRVFERELRQRISTHERLCDDKVITKEFRVPFVYSHTNWGLEEKWINSDHRKEGASRWDPALNEESDLDRMHFPEIVVDSDASAKKLATAQELFGDILEVSLGNPFWWTLGPIDILAKLRGMDKLMMDMVDRPEFVHRAMRFLTDGQHAMLDQCVNQNLLSLNNGAHYVGSGGFGFTKKLPQEDFDGNVRPCDMWGFCEAQLIAHISPAMHDEFAITYQAEILDRFGLSCYGCCEPLSRKFEILRKIPRLRRISISPWADVNEASEKLPGWAIFSWKPNPSMVVNTYDEETIRKHIRETLELATSNNCTIEVILKDLVSADPAHLEGWTKIATEEAVKFA